MTKAGRTAIVAVGGNSLILDGQHQSIPDQYKAAAESSRHIADMIETGITVVLTHGNGPQVGFILHRSNVAKGIVPEVPIDYATADTQGARGRSAMNSGGAACAGGLRPSLRRWW